MSTLHVKCTINVLCVGCKFGKYLAKSPKLEKKTLEQNQWTCCGRLFLDGVHTKPYIVLKCVSDRECGFIKKKMSNEIDVTNSIFTA